MCRAIGGSFLTGVKPSFTSLSLSPPLPICGVIGGREREGGAVFLGVRRQRVSQATRFFA